MEKIQQVKEEVTQSLDVLRKHQGVSSELKSQIIEAAIERLEEVISLIAEMERGGPGEEDGLWAEGWEERGGKP